MNYPRTWVSRDDDDFWYICENRVNTLINYSEKIFAVVDKCNSKRLSECYRNALDGRPFKYPFPPEHIIQSYLESSVYFKNIQGDLFFIGETTELNEIEKVIFNFFSTNHDTNLPTLRDYLIKNNINENSATKTLSYTPFIYIDKLLGRKKHIYSFIGTPKSDANNKLVNDDRYAKYLLRLRRMIDDGTDETVDQIARKEQYVLREWLFEGKEYENCAICGRKFKVTSLVTAHKKNRSICNDAERLDPYIVMPVCLMGCDYLYEKMYIYIEEGLINRGLFEFGDGCEKAIVESLLGRKLDYEWLKGLSSYFKKPSNIIIQN